MDSKIANKIPLKDILTKYGKDPVKSYAAYDMYRSPFRDEINASFKVNKNTNKWADFGEGSYGGVIDLVMRIELCTFHEAMKKIEEREFKISPIFRPEIRREKQENEAKDSKFILLKKALLENKILLDYIKKRGITAEIAQQYCQEIYYKIGENGKNCFAVAFENQNKGLEYRNAVFKGCFSHKDISFFDKGGNECAVFEGFFDMLSYLEIVKNTPEKANVNLLVLNSTSLVSQAEEIISKHEKISSFLDTDKAGQKALEAVKSMNPNVDDVSGRVFPKLNDLNEYLQERIKSQSQKKNTEHKNVNLHEVKQVNKPIKRRM